MHVVKPSLWGPSHHIPASLCTPEHLLASAGISPPSSCISPVFPTVSLRLPVSRCISTYHCTP